MTRTIIVDRALAQDRWQIVAAGSDVPAAGDVIIGLAAWIEQRRALRARAGRTGVWLEPGDDPAALAGDLAALPLIAVHFPQFVDGRGYSTARLLRERYGFKGELRAFGDVLRDQLFYLERVGFNAFVLKEGGNVGEALAAFADFSDAYQSSALQPAPYFRRRGAGMVARPAP